MRWPARCVFALCVFTLAAVSVRANAEPSEAAVAAARELAAEGGELLENEKYAEAADRLEKAYAVVKLPTVAFHLGHALAMSGRWVEAAERYREATLMPVPDKMRSVHEEARKRAQARLDTLEPRIPKLDVVIEGVRASDVQVLIDNEAMPAAVLGTSIRLDPGEHLVSGLHGEHRVDEKVVAVEGETVRVVLSMPPLSMPEPAVEPPPPPPPPVPQPPPPVQQPPPPDTSANDGAWMTPAGWVALGLGGAGAVVGAITGGLLLADDSSIECIEEGCAPSQADDIDRFNTLRPITTVGLIVAGVGVAAGITLLLMAPDDSTDAALLLSPADVRLRLRF